jgi:hypothetical protein
MRSAGLRNKACPTGKTVVQQFCAILLLASLVTSLGRHEFGLM